MKSHLLRCHALSLGLQFPQAPDCVVAVRGPARVRSFAAVQSAADRPHRGAHGHVAMNSEMLIAATLILPLAMLAACVSQRLRDRMPALLVFAPLPAIAAALQELQGVNGTILVLPKALLGLTFELDRPGEADLAMLCPH